MIPIADDPHIAVEHDDRYGVVAQLSHENPVADHALRQVGFRPLPGEDQYVLAPPERDATRRAQRAVQSLRAAHFPVTASPQYEVQPRQARGERGRAGLRLEPDVAFGRDPDLGVVAAVADDRPFLDEALRAHGFRYSDRQDLYLLPTGTPHNTAVQAVAGASTVLQNSRLAVLADPQIMTPPPVPTPNGSPRREPAPATSVSALTADLHQTRRSIEVSDLFDQVTDERLRVVAELEEFVDTAAAWCDRLGTPNGKELAGHLRATAVHVDDLRDHLTEAQLNLADMPDTTPEAAPPLTSLTSSHQRDARPLAHEARTRAASWPPLTARPPHHHQHRLPPRRPPHHAAHADHHQSPARRRYTAYGHQDNLVHRPRLRRHRRGRPGRPAG